MYKINRRQFDKHPNVLLLKSCNKSWDKQRKWCIILNNKKFDLRKKIKPLLERMTNSHCSFCDFFPVKEGIYPGRIEHFAPKDKYPELGYSWENLYYCCECCTNKKGNKFNENLIRPDDEGYDFSLFFIISMDGKLMPHPKAPIKKQEQAKITIDIYNLNRPELRRYRKDVLFEALRNKIYLHSDYSNRPFRFIFQIIEITRCIDNCYWQHFKS